MARRPPLSADSGIILREEIVKTFSRFTFDEIKAKTDEHNLFGAPVRELHEAYHEPQAIHNGSIVVREHLKTLAVTVVALSVAVALCLIWCLMMFRSATTRTSAGCARPARRPS